MDAWIGQKSSGDEVQHAALDQAEAEVEQDAIDHVVYVNRKANAGSNVADDGLGDAVDAERMIGQPVLKQADEGAGDRAGDGVAAGYREKDSRNQWEVDVVELCPGFRQHRLEQNAEQGRQHGDDGSKRVLVELGSRCVTVLRHGGWWVSV